MDNPRTRKDLRRKGPPLSREPLEGTLAIFAEWLPIQGYARRTVECYHFDAVHFARWLASRGVETFGDLIRDHLTGYQAALAARPGRSGRPLSAQTRAHATSAILALGKFLAERRITSGDVALGLAFPKVPRKLPDNLLTVREVERLLAVPPLDDPVGLRNRALMELLYATGLRQSEALDLKLGDVDLSQAEARVVSGKGGYGRVVPLCREAVAVLSAYLAEARPALAAQGDSGHFFLSRRGQRPDPSRILKTFKRYATAAGIKRPVGFHTFRHSVATHLLQRGVGIRHIQELLGHHSLTSTQIYTKVTISDLKRAHAKHHPRERMDV